MSMGEVPRSIRGWGLFAVLLACLAYMYTLQYPESRFCGGIGILRSVHVSNELSLYQKLQGRLLSAWCDVGSLEAKSKITCFEAALAPAI